MYLSQLPALHATHTFLSDKTLLIADENKNPTSWARSYQTPPNSVLTSTHFILWTFTRGWFPFHFYSRVKDTKASGRQITWLNERMTAKGARVSGGLELRAVTPWRHPDLHHFPPAGQQCGASLPDPWGVSQAGKAHIACTKASVDSGKEPKHANVPLQEAKKR